MIWSFVLPFLNWREVSFFFKSSGSIKTLSSRRSLHGSFLSSWLSYFVISSLFRWVRYSIVGVKSLLFFVYHLVNSILVSILHRSLVILRHLLIKILLLFIVSLSVFCQLVFCHFSSILHLLFSLISQLNFLFVPPSSYSLKIFVFTLSGKSLRSYKLLRLSWVSLWIVVVNRFLKILLGHIIVWFPSWGWQNGVIRTELRSWRSGRINLMKIRRLVFQSFCTAIDN